MKYKIFIKNNSNENLKIKDYILDFFNKNNWKYDDKKPDFFFIIGGDGSFIKTINVDYKNNNNIIYILIKDSDIGFYYDFEKKDIKKILNNIILKKINIEKIPLLEIKLIPSNDIFFALNEMKIINYNYPIKFDCYINNNILKTINGTGIVISTSNGSSGFANSINGAIMLSNDLIQLKEIAPVINFKNNYFSSNFILNNNDFINLNFLNNDFNIIVDNLNIKNRDIKNILIKISNKSVLKIGKHIDIKYRINKLRNIFLNNN